MLADVRGDDRIEIFGQFVQAFDDLLWLDGSFGFLLVAQRMALLPFADLIPPGFTEFLLLPIDRGPEDLIQLAQHRLAVPDDGNIDVDILSDRCGIDIYVDDL